MTAPSNWIFDSQVIQELIRCERKAYFHFVKDLNPQTGVWNGWVPDREEPALVFGLAWHKAMDFVWVLLHTGERRPLTLEELTAGALNAFLKEWDLWGLDHEAYYPRAPGRAMDMISVYLTQYAQIITTCELLSVEETFSVMLDPEGDVTYHGRMDKVIRHPVYNNKVLCMDHKTTSSFKRFNWMDSFSPNIQIDGYLHAGHSNYGEEFGGVIIDGAVVQKTDIDFTQIFVDRQFEQMDSWLWEMHYHMESFFKNYGMLLDFRSDPTHQDRAAFMPAFPKRTIACSDFGGCPYLTLCKARANPETWDQPPHGFTQKSWNPLEVKT